MKSKTLEKKERTWKFGPL